MNERERQLERDLRAVLREEAQSIAERLDERLEGRWRPRPEPRRGRAWRPTLALALLVLAFGLSTLWWARQAPGPAASEVGVVPGERPWAALYEATGQLEVDRANPLSGGAQEPAPPVAPFQNAPPIEASVPTLRAFALEATGEVNPLFELRRASQRYRVRLADEVAAVGFLGDALVYPDPGSGRVVAVSAEGRAEVLAQGLERPVGVAVDGQGRVWVSEHAPQGRLLVLEAQGPVAFRSDLVYPAGLAFGPDGSLYLAEQGRGRVLRFVPVDGRLTPQGPIEVVATGFGGRLSPTGGEPARLGGPYALTVTEGALWASGLNAAGELVLYRFPRARSGWWPF